MSKKKLKVLELFAGTRSIGKEFEKRGHEVFSIELDTQHENIDWYADITKITAEEIIERFGQPDVVWASPPCQRFSVASIGHHWIKGTNDPKTEEAKVAVIMLEDTLNLIKNLDPTYYFVENPRGKMRKLDMMQNLPMHTVTYCQYGDTRMKPTDIWTNHPNPRFKPPCKNGDPCHVAAPRGSRTGTQGLKGSVLRSVIPADLCKHIAIISEDKPTYTLIDINEEDGERFPHQTFDDLVDMLERVWEDDENTEGFYYRDLNIHQLNAHLEGIGYAAESEVKEFKDSTAIQQSLL